MATQVAVTDSGGARARRNAVRATCRPAWMEVGNARLMAVAADVNGVVTTVIRVIGHVMII